MKKLFLNVIRGVRINFSNFIFATLLLGIIVLSCSKDNALIPTTTTNNSVNISSSKITEDSISYEDEGIFLYKTLKFHSQHFDPYTMLPEKDKKILKEKVDSVKALKISDPNLIWEKHLKENKISNKTFQKLKKFSGDALRTINTDPSPDAVDKWFIDDISNTKKDKNLDRKEKEVVIHHSTLMRYAIKAFLENNISKNGVKNGKVQASCILELVSCFWGNISTYAGIGAEVGGPTGSAGAGVGGSVGALAGAFISFNSCTCTSESCAYPKYLSTPDVCYNQYNGLDFAVGGVSSDTHHLKWYFTDNNGIPFLIKTTTANTTRLYHSELNGRTYVEVYVSAECDGKSYETLRVGINTDILGKPSFFISGNTYPTVGSPQFYSISGRNLNTVNWGVGSIGQITSQNSYGIYVNWYSTGYAYLYADAQSACGSINNGINVVVHN
jgi:hypothetical protein